MAWDLAGAFQRSRAAENDWRGDPLAVGALQQLIQGDAGVPGASPMPGAAPPGGGGQPTGSPPQQGSPPPQPQQQQVNPLQAVLQRLQMTPSQGGGAGGQQPPPQPSQGPAPAPPTNAQIPGSQPMRPAPGPFQQPGQPPQQQQPQPQQQPQQQQGWGGQPGQAQGPLDLRKVIQSVVRTAGPNADPHRIMAAVSKLAPLMNLDSQIQFRQMSEALRLSQQENQLRIAQLNARSREDVAGIRSDTQRDVAAGHDASAERRMQMRPEVEAYESFLEKYPDATPEQKADFFSGQVKGGYRRAETAAGAQQTRRDIAAGQQETQRRGQDLRREGQAEAESGRNRRALMSRETKLELQQLTADARKEIEQMRQSGKMDAALLSANTKLQIRKLSEDARRELFEMGEAGKMERTRQQQEGATLRTEEQIASREKVAAGKQEQQQKQFDVRTGQQERRLGQTDRRLDQADTREQRIGRNQLVAQDQRHQMLAQAQARLEQQILASGQRNALSQWRAVVDAAHKRAMELIQMYSANQGLDPKIAKNLEKEQNELYARQLAEMKEMVALKPGTVKDGHMYQGGDPREEKNWKAIGAPSQAGSPGVTQPTMGE